MKILDVAFKDLKLSFRSVFAIGMMVLAPLLLTGLIYFAFGSGSGGDVSAISISVGVVNADQLPADSVFEAPIGDNIRSMFFDESVASWITAFDYADEASAREALDKQEIGVAVIIPQDFTEQYESGEQNVQVSIVSDPTLSYGPAVVKDIVTTGVDGYTGSSIARETILERLQTKGIQYEQAQISSWLERYGNWYKDFQRNLFHNPDQAALVLVAPSAGEMDTVDPIQKSMSLVMAGQMIFFAFFSGAYSMMSILQESEDGTLARMFTTPTDRTSILMGKFAAVFITVVMQGLVLMVAGHYAFGIQWGQPIGAAMALTGQVFAATGLGVFLISFVKTTRQGGPVLGGGLTALGMLGGLFTANIPNMPASFNALANFTPQGWVIKIWKLVMDGLPVDEILAPFSILIVMGVLLFAVGALMFRRRFA